MTCTKPPTFVRCLGMWCCLTGHRRTSATGLLCCTASCAPLSTGSVSRTAALQNSSLLMKQKVQCQDGRSRAEGPNDRRPQSRPGNVFACAPAPTTRSTSFASVAKPVRTNANATSCNTHTRARAHSIHRQGYKTPIEAFWIFYHSKPLASSLPVYSQYIHLDGGGAAQCS